MVDFRNTLKCGWTVKSCIDWLDPPDDAHREILESLDLAELRKRVFEESSRIKWLVKADAVKLGHGFVFTPPHLGKHFNLIELTWALDKHKFRGTPTAARKGDKASMQTLVSCIKELRDVSDYIVKPALYTRACLRSARDFVHETYQRSEGSKKEALLLAEVHASLAKFGRERRSGEAPVVDLAGAVPDAEYISWRGVRLNSSDPGPATTPAALLSERAVAKLAATATHKQMLQNHWEQYLQKQAEAALQAQAQKEELERKQNEDAELRIAVRESKRRRKAEEAVARERQAAQRRVEEDIRAMQAQELEWEEKRRAADEKARGQEEARILLDCK